MLEPLAATVFNSLLSGRPLAGHNTTAQSALKMVARASRPALPQDFFTPHPRRLKGKEKALPHDDPSACTNPSMTDVAAPGGLSTGVRHVPVLRDLSSCRHRARRIHGRKMLHAPSGNGLSFLHHFPSTRNVDLRQRRHASSLPEHHAASTSSPAESRHDKWRRTITDYASGAKTSDPPEKVWHAYESLQNADGCASMEVMALLDYGSRIAATVEWLHRAPDSAEQLSLWGARLQTLLHRLAAQIEDIPLDPAHFRWRCLLACGEAMTGNVESAVEAAGQLQASPILPELRAHVVQMHACIVVSTHRHRDAESVLQYLVEQWSHLETYLMRRKWIFRDDHPLFHRVRSFKNSVITVLSCVEKPVAFMVDVEQDWSPEARRRAGSLLIDALCEVKLGNDALDVLDTMRRQSLSVRVELQMVIVKALVKVQSFESATTLFMSLSSQALDAHLFNEYLCLGLYLYAHQGDVPRAESYFNRLLQRDWVTRADMNMMMHAHAIKGDVDRVVQLFHHFFPPPTLSQPEPHKPNIFHYTTVIFAYAQIGDFLNMNKWLELMTVAKIVPDDHVYTIILQSFASRGEVGYIVDLLTQMRAAGVPPTKESYTVIITLLAKRMDAPAAEALFKQALSEGIVPDRQLITSLMNAYVQAGQWDGVIRAFDYLNTSAHRGFHISIEVYNTLLRAYVQIGAPFRVVANLFQKLELARMRPDGHTFALLIQSACDSGLMEIAMELFAEMERLAGSWQSYRHINVYVLTIIMSGYLRMGMRGKAKGIFDEMRKRGIQPTAATYAAIVKAYGSEPSGAGLQVAQDFIATLVDSDPDARPWMRQSGGRALALQTVYAPLLAAYAQRERPDQVDRLLQEMLDAGGEPSLGSLTALLDAHRRTGNVDAARAIWPKIYELGMDYAKINQLLTDTDRGAQPDLRGHGVVMCIPLSIYIDALSAAGRHYEVADTWRSLMQARLAFDSHNWNHLAVALIRAGEVERAFEIVERVIIPYERKLKAAVRLERERNPDTPTRVDVPEDDAALQFPSESPLRNRDRRANAVQTSTRKLRPSMEEGGEEDFAHVLHVLAQVSPLWNVWRPHEATLDTLYRALTHLESGRLVQPVKPSNDGPEPPLDIRAIRQRRAQASEIMERIYDNYPDTLKLVRHFQIVKRSQVQKAQSHRSMSSHQV
ncbi:hypothetical protein WOLCODRAFT_137046 [Wolfiporia cocos MD-104 SS10]|uniref:Pentacotripeptide-repeat region of PRORP domain-containing protein n=1 Tax=Wolfiporia cocos (strain MD-104) TaxID=742152 RepID=A0A2H3JVX0_WOLCO|nr:hypothetical protein WOLCODRAFT_137046 [Wolfiporia cocos MD-104 SS10]